MRASFSGLLIVVVVLGVGMGVAFGSGVAYGRSSAPKATAAEATRATGEQQGSTASGAGRAGTGATGTGATGTGGAGRPVATGTVESLAGGALTVTTAPGASTKVTVGEKTTVQKNVAATIGDLKPGDRVVVMGQRGNDGSLTASAIQVLPAGQ